MEKVDNDDEEHSDNSFQASDNDHIYILNIIKQVTPYNPLIRNNV